MKDFLFSGIFTVVAFAIAFWWAGWAGVVVCALLTVMEITLSFDNAVVNATVLKDMSEKWQRRFLTWGILIAVFGMRLVLPVVIVAFATGLHSWDVARLALEQPEVYSQHVLDAHVQIGAFGGMFLLMVFLHFILNEGKEIHWLGMIEEKLAKLGILESVEVAVAMIILLVVQQFLPPEDARHALVAGTVGVVLYVLINGITAIMGNTGGDTAAQIAHTGLMGFIYLQFLDASFSLDGVIGAFAISKDVVIIMLGLGVGAIFVRSLTIYLVHKGTLAKYRYLEHGAHYGIGALAVIMLVSMVSHVPEVVTGLVGLGFVLLSLWSSVRYNKKNKGMVPSLPPRH